MQHIPLCSRDVLLLLLLLLAVCSCVGTDTREGEKYWADDVSQRAGERSE